MPQRHPQRQQLQHRQHVSCNKMLIATLLLAGTMLMGLLNLQYHLHGILLNSIDTGSTGTGTGYISTRSLSSLKAAATDLHRTIATAAVEELQTTTESEADSRLSMESATLTMSAAAATHRTQEANGIDSDTHTSLTTTAAGLLLKEYDEPSVADNSRTDQTYHSSSNEDTEELKAIHSYSSPDASLNDGALSASVIGMGVGYPLSVYQRFVGSLRKSGYQGHILLLVHESDLNDPILQYFQYRNVTHRVVQTIPHEECVEQPGTLHSLMVAIKKEACSATYPNLKLRWARYPLLRDFLALCHSCTGPVLHVDVRDTFFQRNPFELQHIPIQGLHLFQEHETHRTTFNFVAMPLKLCKNMVIDEPGLCSGSTAGERHAMLQYLNIMYAELLAWSNNPNCTNFSDQCVHNYIYYSGMLDGYNFNVSSIPNQSGGMVHTVMRSAVHILRDHFQHVANTYNVTKIQQALQFPFQGASENENNGLFRWVDAKWNLIDDQGYFIEADGSRSRVVHKWDRFGSFFNKHWLNKQEWLEDSVPENF